MRSEDAWRRCRRRASAESRTVMRSAPSENDDIVITHCLVSRSARSPDVASAARLHIGNPVDLIVQTAVVTTVLANGINRSSAATLQLAAMPTHSATAGKQMMKECSGKKKPGNVAANPAMAIAATIFHTARDRVDEQMTTAWKPSTRSATSGRNSSTARGRHAASSRLSERARRLVDAMAIHRQARTGPLNLRFEESSSRELVHLIDSIAQDYAGAPVRSREPAVT